MNQMLWNCLNRYRVYTKFDHLLKKAEKCEVEVKGKVLLSHISELVMDEELEELNKKRKSNKMQPISKPFCALSLYDAELLGEPNRKNGHFWKFLHERIKAETTKDKKHSKVLHLISWMREPVQVMDKNTEKKYPIENNRLQQELPQGTEVSVKVTFYKGEIPPGYGLTSVTILKSSVVSEKEQIEKDVMEKVISNNKDISNLLDENLNLLWKHGLSGSTFDATFEDDRDKIHFPRKYIRTTDYFIEVFHLDSIFRNEDIRSNVAYCWQMADLYSFIDNYFYTYGSVYMTLKKSAFINLATIMEAIVVRTIEDVRACCHDCQYIETCEYNFSARKNKFSERISKLKKMNLLHMDDSDYEFLEKCYELRNHIHLATQKEEEVKNELKSYAEDFEKQYDDLVDFMPKLADHVYEYLYPGTKQCLKEYAELNG